MKYEVELTDEQAGAYVRSWEARPPAGYASLPWQAEVALADAIRAQMPKPRMAEPGWGEKVIAEDPHHRPRTVFLRVAYDGWQNDRGHTYRWADLIDPEPAQ